MLLRPFEVEDVAWAAPLADRLFSPLDRGYGEAVTWAATLCLPELPATLQASPMGRPIYERMGYRTIAEFTVWDLER